MAWFRRRVPYEDLMASFEDPKLTEIPGDLDLMRGRAAVKSEFKINARELKIAGSDKPQNWQWKTDGNGLEVAKAVSTTGFEVKGSFNTTNLWPDRQYKVLFLTRMEETDSKTDTMGGQEVSLKLSLPYTDSRTQRTSWPPQERQEKLPLVNSSQELEVGQFTMRGANSGTMHFAMEGLFRRSSGGLVIEGAVVRAA